MAATASAADGSASSLLDLSLDAKLCSVIAQSYEGCTDEHGCFSGLGKLDLVDGATYKGIFSRGFMHGPGGIYEWKEPAMRFEGDFFNNALTGEGRYTWPDGSSYEGQVENGLRHGRGTYKHGGDVYSGDWVRGKRNGHGVQKYATGAEYEGEWKKDQRHGYGSMLYPSGNKFTGNFVADDKSGHGVMEWFSERERYEGAWEKDLQHGYGEHAWFGPPTEGPGSESRPLHEMCNVYRGEWLSGMRHGEGEFLFATGARLIGSWEANKKHGNGLFICEDGRAARCTFEEDRLIFSDVPLEKPRGAPPLTLRISDLLPADPVLMRQARKDAERAVAQAHSDMLAMYRTASSTCSSPDPTLSGMTLAGMVTFCGRCKLLVPHTNVDETRLHFIVSRMHAQHTAELGLKPRKIVPFMARGASEEEYLQAEGDPSCPVMFRAFVEGLLRLACVVQSEKIEGPLEPAEAFKKILSENIYANVPRGSNLRLWAKKTSNDDRSTIEATAVTAPCPPSASGYQLFRALKGGRIGPFIKAALAAGVKLKDVKTAIYSELPHLSAVASDVTTEESAASLLGARLALPQFAAVLASLERAQSSGNAASLAGRILAEM